MLRTLRVGYTHITFLLSYFIWLFSLQTIWIVNQWLVSSFDIQWTQTHFICVVVMRLNNRTNIEISVGVVRRLLYERRKTGNLTRAGFFQINWWSEKLSARRSRQRPILRCALIWNDFKKILIMNGHFLDILSLSLCISAKTRLTCDKQ